MFALIILQESIHVPDPVISLAIQPEKKVKINEKIPLISSVIMTVRECSP